MKLLSLSLSLLSLKWVINSVIVKDNISNKSWRIIQSIQYPFQSIPFRPSNSTHSDSCDHPTMSIPFLSISLNLIQFIESHLVYQFHLFHPLHRPLSSPLHSPPPLMPFCPSNFTHSASCDYPIQWCTNSICSLYLLHRPLSNPFHHPSPPALLPRLNEPLKILVALSCFPKYHLQRTSQKIQNLNI